MKKELTMEELEMVTGADSLDRLLIGSDPDAMVRKLELYVNVVIPAYLKKWFD